MKDKPFSRHGLFIFLLLISSLIPACATRHAASNKPGTASASPDQPVMAPAIASATGWPAAFVSEPGYNFGTVVDGSKVIHEFKIENQGDAPLRISNITTGCSCAVPEYPKIVFPGEKGKIIITIDTNGFGGREFSKLILVSTNEPNNAMLNLTISGQVSLFADIAPKSLIFKGSAGETVQAASVITPHEEYPFSITGFELDDALKDLVSIDITRDGKKFIVTAKNKMKTAGQYLGKMIIKTDSSVKPEIKIFIRGTIR